MSTRKPRSLHIAGLSHGQTPIPAGARVGPMLFSSGIPGKDPQTNALPSDPAQQVRFAFENMRTLLANGGATLADVGRVTVLVTDESLRELVNAEWVKCFPDPDDRPARHTQVQALRGGMLLQLDVTAVIQEERP